MYSIFAGSQAGAGCCRPPCGGGGPLSKVATKVCTAAWLNIADHFDTWAASTHVCKVARVCVALCLARGRMQFFGGIGSRFRWPRLQVCTIRFQRAVCRAAPRKVPASWIAIFSKLSPHRLDGNLAFVRVQWENFAATQWMDSIRSLRQSKNYAHRTFLSLYKTLW